MLFPTYNINTYKMPSAANQAKPVEAPFLVLFIILVSVVGPLYLFTWSLDLFLCWIFGHILSASEWCWVEWRSGTPKVGEHLDREQDVEQISGEADSSEADLSPLAGIEFDFSEPSSLTDDASPHPATSATPGPTPSRSCQPKSTRSTRSGPSTYGYIVPTADPEQVWEDHEPGYMPTLYIPDYRQDSCSSSRSLEVQYQVVDERPFRHRQLRHVNFVRQQLRIQTPSQTISNVDSNLDRVSNTAVFADASPRPAETSVSSDPLHRYPARRPCPEPESDPQPVPGGDIISSISTPPPNIPQGSQTFQTPERPTRRLISKTLLRPLAWTQKLSSKRRRAAHLPTTSSRTNTLVPSASRTDLSQTTTQVSSGRRRLRLYICWSKTRCSNPARCRRHRHLLRDAPFATLSSSPSPPPLCASPAALTPIASYELPSPVLSLNQRIGTATTPDLNINSDFEPRESTPVISASPLPIHPLRPALPPRPNHQPIPERTRSLNFSRKRPKPPNPRPPPGFTLRGGADRPPPPPHHHGRRRRQHRGERVPDNTVVSQLIWWLAGGRPVASDSAPITAGYLRGWRRRSDRTGSGLPRTWRQEFVYGISGGRWCNGRFRDLPGDGGTVNPVRVEEPGNAQQHSRGADAPDGVNDPPRSQGEAGAQSIPDWKGAGGGGLGGEPAAPEQQQQQYVSEAGGICPDDPAGHFEGEEGIAVVGGDASAAGQGVVFGDGHGLGHGGRWRRRRMNKKKRRDVCVVM